MWIAAPQTNPSLRTLMTRTLHVCLLLFLSLLASSCTTPAQAPAGDGPLILISIDGFRWDYLQKFDAPTLRQLAAAGVHATRMTPSFPTKTFPNHYTLVTGLRPARHGIVGNWFYDPGTGETFGMKKPESNTNPRWWGGEPVWITAEKQGVRSGCYFWPGSEAPHDNLHASFWMPFDDKTPSQARTDGVLHWLEKPPAERPRFVTLYFSAVDHAGHRVGPDSPDMQKAITEVDEAIARLLAGLDRLGLRDRASFVIVSDHGMSPTSPERVVFLDDLVDLNSVEVEATGTYAGIRPRPGTRTAAELAAAIRAKAPPQVQVYERDHLPARFHYGNNDRIPAVMLVPDDQWTVEPKVGWPARSARFEKGSHGWDPATTNMGALFIASGPAFRRHVEIPDVENIHVYNLLCAALGIAPATNDGDARLVQQALRR
jgi:predicted AlkP superfamily pyrophosphatase or phosphodiesterase